MIAAGTAPPREVLLPPQLDAGLRPPALGGQLHTLAGETMGTTWQVRAVGPATADLVRLRVAIDETLAGIDAAMSPWRADSDIVRHQRAAPGTWTALSAATTAVLATACEVAEASEGAFDPSVGAAVDRWGFGPASEDAMTVDGPAANWRALRFDRATGRVFQPGGVRLDLCGIAKGDAVDRVSERLSGEGWTDHLVEIGGELRGRGLRPDGQPWWVEVEAPPGLSPAVDCRVGLLDMAIATSGDYRRVRHDRRQGRSWSHTVDPRDGRPLRSPPASVTVLHPRCREADAYATALMVLGPDAGRRWADARGLPACFVLRRGPGRAERLCTAAWQAWAA